MLSVLLLQLPVPNNPAANVPLAAGYLKAYAQQQGLLDQCKIELLPRAVQDHGGDALLVAAVVAHRPDVLGVSLYTWNSERSLALVERIKQQLPDLWVIVGGPDVQRDNAWVLHHPAVDVAVLGEGEQTFCDLLHWKLAQRTDSALPLTSIPGLALRSGDGLDFTPARVGLDDLAVLPSPYLLGYLELVPGGIAFVECSRWCPYRCSFCLYGRNLGSKLGNRLFPVERVAAEVAWAKAHGAAAVHFVEANLNLLPYFRALTTLLHDLNADRALHLYAELRGEHLSETAVLDLVTAGLTVAEVGLQSANPAALAAVDRRTDLLKWAAGTRRLYAHGVEVLLDVILGLPEDDDSSVRRTLDWIVEQQLGPYDVFMLQVLPGTTIRERAAQHGLVFQDRPPYYVLATAALAFHELRALRWELKERAGFDPQAVEGMPEIDVRAWAVGDGVYAATAPDEVGSRALDTTPPPTHFLLDCNTGADWQAVGTAWSQHVAAHLTVQVRHFDAAVLQAWAWPIAHANPTIHWDIVLHGPPPAPAALRALHRAWPHTIGYLDRIAVYQEPTVNPPYRKVTPRWTLIVPWGSAVTPMDYEGIAQVVWHVSAATIATQIERITAHGGAGLLVTAADAAMRARLAAWQQETGWLVWFSDK